MTFVLKNLISNMSMIIVVAYFVSRVGMFKNLVTDKKNGLREKLIMAVIFGMIGILATYTGVSVNGAIANSRIIGVLVGGIFGGPLVGLGAGLIAGVHRWAIDIGGFTALACAVSTTTEGIIGGIASRYIKNRSHNWVHAFMIGILAEALQMVIILVMAKPFPDALELVEIIWIPMVLLNPVGIALFVGFIDTIYREQEKEAAIQTQLALNIAEKCLGYLRKGLSSAESMKEVAKTILEMSGAAAVAITDRKSVIAHVGAGIDHHLPGIPIQTKLTRQVLDSGEISTAQSPHEIGCSNGSCRLRSAVIVPLLKKGDVIGTVKLYKVRENAITDVDLRLATGLARLFSTQLELADVDYQVKLRQKAELKALQSQINPHFLFNALNTITSFCRLKPDRARELLIDLSTYFRNTLKHGDDFVSLDTELKHVNAYLSLEKARFEEKLVIEEAVGEGVECMLPPFVLQPIVENAVKHGVLPMEHGGSVRISAVNDENDVVLAVEDTGEGIDPGIIEQMYSNTLPKSKIGLLNVHNRLKSIYGEEYGLRILPVPSGGTRVEIRIPKRLEVDFLHE